MVAPVLGNQAQAPLRVASLAVHDDDTRKFVNCRKRSRADSVNRRGLMISAGQSRTTFRWAPSPGHADGVSRLRGERSFVLTTATRFHQHMAFAAMRATAQCSATRRLPKGCAMATATRTAISAVRYFVTPLALYIALVAIGTYARYSNLLVEIIVLCGLFVAVFFGLARKSYIKALMLICSVSIIAISIVRFGDDPVRRTLYKADALLRPNFDEKCFPPEGVLLINGDTLRLCSTYDYVGWVDLILKIDGPYPAGHLTSADLSPAVGNKLASLGQYSFVFGLPNTVTKHLVADYYLIRVLM
jgi:hypothetical protein